MGKSITCFSLSLPWLDFIISVQPELMLTPILMMCASFLEALDFPWLQDQKDLSSTQRIIFS